MRGAVDDVEGERYRRGVTVLLSCICLRGEWRLKDGKKEERKGQTTALAMQISVVTPLLGPKLRSALWSGFCSLLLRTQVRIRRRMIFADEDQSKATKFIHCRKGRFVHCTKENGTSSVVAT